MHNYALDKTYFFSESDGEVTPIVLLASIKQLFVYYFTEDIAKALLDITGDITHTTDETPESVPEPSPVMGLWTVVFALLGLSRLKRKKPVEACKPLL